MLTNLMVMSLDGEITGSTQETSAERVKMGLSNPDDQALLHQEIQKADAIFIGANSVRAEGRVLSLKNKKGKYPTWCIFTNSGLENASLEFWKQTEIPRILVSKQKLTTPPPSSVETWHYQDSPPGASLLAELRRRGMKSFLLLGGGGLNQLFYEEGLVDELKLTLAPLLLGKGIARFLGGRLHKTSSLELLSCVPKGSFVFLHYKVRKN